MVVVEVTYLFSAFHLDNGLIQQQNLTVLQSITKSCLIQSAAGSNQVNLRVGLNQIRATGVLLLGQANYCHVNFFHKFMFFKIL
jgi:hypothetical protein